MEIFKLPHNVVREIGKYVFKRTTSGKSGADTFFLFNGMSENRYFKIMPKNLNNSLKTEACILKWLSGLLPVPEVLLLEEDDINEYLLISEIKGIPAHEQLYTEDMPRLVHLLAKGMRMIHSIDIKDCPFDQRLDTKILAARHRMDEGLVDEDDFDSIRQERKADDLFRELTALRPENEDLVFTHGDYCLPNIIINNGDISGFIDWGRGGAADRYQDLALAARSLEYNFDEKWVPLLFKEYGINDIDYKKIEYYKLLDEFFR